MDDPNVITVYKDSVNESDEPKSNAEDNINEKNDSKIYSECTVNDSKKGKINSASDGSKVGSESDGSTASSDSDGSKVHSESDRLKVCSESDGPKINSESDDSKVQSESDELKIHSKYDGSDIYSKSNESKNLANSQLSLINKKDHFITSGKSSTDSLSSNDLSNSADASPMNSNSTSKHNPCLPDSVTDSESCAKPHFDHENNELYMLSGNNNLHDQLKDSSLVVTSVNSVHLQHSRNSDANSDKIVISDTEYNDFTNASLPYEFIEGTTDSSSDFDSELDYSGHGNQFTKSSPDRTVKRPKDRSRSAVKYYELQLEFLESNQRKLLLELSDMRSKLSKQEADFRKALVDIKSEHDAKIEKFSKACEALKKDKESMVVRYASSEKEVLHGKKLQGDLEKKIKDCNRERDSLASKIKALLNEKQAAAGTYEQKVSELNVVKREHEKLKEDVSCKDIKIKWVQNKLKTEMDAHKECQMKLDHTTHRLQEMREEAEQVRRDCQEMIRRYQEAEEIKSVELDHQLKQKLTELEVQKQERCDQEEVYQLLRQELDALKRKQRVTIDENNSLTLKIHSLEKERLEYEQTLSKLKDSQNMLKQEVVDLTARLAEMENLRLQLEREKEKLSACLREIERVRQTNAELQSDMDACHMKEGELLEFTEKLTSKTVYLQSEHTLLEAKAQALEEEVTLLRKQNTNMEQKIAELTTSLEEEQHQKQEETKLLARKLAEKTKAVEQLNIKLDEADNENRVMKRRHITSIKELSRELQQCRKKLDSYESNAGNHCETTSMGSRASSSASLDTMNTVTQNVTAHAPAVPVSPQVTFVGGKIVHHTQSHQSPPVEIDKHVLIERIVKLQKALAKRNDKMEFLEDHVNHLIKELKKKSRLIQNYIIKEETGALTSTSSDQNKIDVAKRGGIMASVYSSHLSDSNMTFELSLEINHKLQAVLEDTLLKNITLKENISTLGEEIARLTAEKRDLSNQLIKHKSIK